jgi:hypothetical protein
MESWRRLRSFLRKLSKASWALLAGEVVVKKLGGEIYRALAIKY